MIPITAFEKAIIIEKFKNAHIVRTMKHDSKRHHYYMAEERAPMNLLRILRGQGNNSDIQKGV